MVSGFAEVTTSGPFAQAASRRIELLSERGAAKNLVVAEFGRTCALGDYVAPNVAARNHQAAAKDDQ